MSDLSDTDANLIERALNDDTDAFGELYMRYLDAIYRYIYFRVDDSRDAEDLTEQVFLKAWEALPGYERQGYPFTSWLYRIAHNTVIDHYRRQKATVALSPLPELELNSNQPNTLDQVIEAEEASMLAAAISQLPDEQQQVIVLRFIEGLRHAEIAQVMDKSKGACRTIQYRALTALSRLLVGSSAARRTDE
jgi:RNA polymerase sigma-70 factor, ECF subfamily